jgi:threonine aldolase
VRKSLGGGMRQVGVLAAAGLVALYEMVDRLAQDHARARMLAEGLAAIPGIIVEPDRVRTNLVFFHLDPESGVAAPDLVRRLRDEFGVWVGGEGRKRLRAVTHYWIGEKEVRAFLDGAAAIMKS